MVIIMSTPIAGADIEADKLPYHVQSLGAEDRTRSQALDLTDLMNRRLAGVSLNYAQGNPLQPDVQFRGFTATPLLGGSEGVAVYLDGMRVNEVFGDTVNWDLIPNVAIERTTLLSGANPVFGLNSLGGALSLRTKTGFSASGTSASFSDGDFNRQEAALETGGHAGQWGWYVMGSNFDEDGWRDLSPSRAANGFGTLSWHGSSTQIDLHAGRGKTRLIGNGAIPVEQLVERRESIFTAPDETSNTLTLVSLQGTTELTPTRRLSGTLYRRKASTLSYNGDTTNAKECETDEDFLCNEEGEPLFDQNGELIASDLDAINNISHRQQRAVGGSIQLAITDPLGAFDSHFAVGAELFRGQVHFDSAVEASILRENRQTTPDTGIFIPDDALAIGSQTHSAGLYLTETLSLSDQLALTVSGRWNRTRIRIVDLTDESPDLNGNHLFSRFNPAVGLTYQVTPKVNFYGGYNESTRVPTPVELTCSDENAPCKLPNQFLADPPLKQVVAHSWELGLRGTWNSIIAVHWHAGFFTTTNAGDILFQVTGGATSNEGFFANVGDTRRRGIETTIEGVGLNDQLHVYANYTYLEATYRTSFLEVSANHPQADDDGIIMVKRGDWIPSLPKHAFKVGADYTFSGRVTVGGDLVSNSGQYLRSDEANLLPQVKGFTVVNLRAQIVLNRHVNVFGRVDNVFDSHYATFGALGEPDEVFPDFDDPTFQSPSAPRAGWLGFRVLF
jgi:outer membrane receptor protein involved in Fe transport